jgi:hypothetical protein
MITINKPVYEQVEQVRQQLSWEEVVELGLELREGKDQVQWRLGDLALQVEKVYGVDSLGKFSIAININKNSLSQYRRVSKAFPEDSRSKLLSHRHHLILAGQENRFELLKECEDNGTTTSQLELRYSRNPQSTMEKKEALVCQKCHKLIVKSYDVCKCVK